MKKTLPTLFALLLVSTVALPAMAQPGPGGRGRGGPPAGQGMMRSEQMVGKALRNKLGLSEAKAKKVEGILKQHRAAQQKIKGRLRTARQDLGKLFRSDSNDQKAWKAALDKMEKGHKALAQGRDKQFAALKKVLTPKEQAKLLRGLNQLQRRMKARRGQRGQQGMQAPKGRRGQQGQRGQRGQRGQQLGPRKTGRGGPPGGGGPRFGGPGPGFDIGE